MVAPLFREIQRFRLGYHGIAIDDGCIVLLTNLVWFLRLKPGEVET